jgi:hypothetical protein
MEKCATNMSTQMQQKKSAGYFSKNVNNDSLQYLRDVLKERHDEPA